MKKVFKLEVIDDSDLLVQANEAGNVLETCEINVNGKSFVVFRLEGKILGFEYSKTRKKFEFRWKKNIKVNPGINPLQSYPMWTYDVDGDGTDDLILRDKDGLKVYRITSDGIKLELLGKSALFHDAYGENQGLLIGKFYKDSRQVGVMRRDKIGANNFYVFKRDCWGKPDCDVLKRLSATLELSDTWKQAETRFDLSQLKTWKSQNIFVARTQTGLEFYQFNGNYQIESFLGESLLINLLGPQHNDEQIFFGSFTNQIYKDVLHLNTSGLFLYRFDGTDYIKIHHDLQFSIASGWTSGNTKTLRASDLNSDGKSDIIFTGIDGLAFKSYDIVAGSWQDFTGSVEKDDRFSTVVGIFNFNGEILAIVQSPNGSLKHATISSETTVDGPKTEEEKTPEQIQKPKIQEGSISINNIKKMPFAPDTTDGPRSYHRWTEQWAEKFEQNIFLSVPNADGYVAFNVPLVELRLSQFLKVQIALSYDDKSQDSNVVGFGWNISLLSDLIRVDHRCSIFIEDSIFTFVGMGQEIVLKRKASLETSGSNILRFIIPNQTNTEVSYFTGPDSYWVIETLTERFVYGMDETNGAVQMNLSWQNYRCGKTDLKSLKKIPVAWFLKERQDKTIGKSIYYRYNIASSMVASCPEAYTSMLSLRSISDEEKELISFGYLDKNREEVTPITVINMGKVTFPIPLLHATVLAKISVRSGNCLQDFIFNYENKKHRLLLGINQVIEESSVRLEKILEMKYVEIDDQILMKTLELPRGSSISFDHEKLSRFISHDALIKRFPVGRQSSITPGPNYKIIAFVRGNKINLRIHDGIDSDTVIDFIVGYSPFGYRIVAATSSMFLILLSSESKTEVVVFQKEEPGFKEASFKEIGFDGPIARYKFAKNVPIYTGENFAAIIDQAEKYIKILQWDAADAKKGLMIRYLHRAVKKIFSNRRMMIACDGDYIVVFYLDSEGEWQTKNVKEVSGLEKSTIDVINKFDVRDKLKTELIKSIEDNLFQVDGNQFVFTYLKENAGIISVVLHMLVLDSKYNVEEQIYVIKRQNVYTIDHYETISNTRINFQYKNIEGKFSLRAQDIISGGFYDNIMALPANKRNEAKKDLLARLNAKEDWQAVFKQMFALDWAQYLARLTPSGLWCGEDFIFEMTGTNWKRKSASLQQGSKASKRFDLGPNLHVILSQDDQKASELTFYDPNAAGSYKELYKMKLEGEFINNFPLYLAYQSSNDIKLITFTTELNLGPVKTIPDAKLIQGNMDSVMVLVTSKTLDHTEPMEIQQRPLLEYLVERVEYIISKKTLAAGDLQRVTSYERHFEIGEDGTLSELFVKISGGAKEEFGWYEDFKSISGANKVVTKNKKIYHASGKMKTHEFVSEKAKNLIMNDGENDEKADFSQKLMDKSETLEISDLRPHKVEDENFAFIGFESYERKSIGNVVSARSWKFNEKNVIRKEFSLTGESFLRLTEAGETLEGTIKPKDRDQIFVASCWIRTKVDMKMNQETEYFYAAVETESNDGSIRSNTILEQFSARVKRVSGEWNYLEILIDLKAITKKYGSSPNFQIVLQVNNKNKRFVKRFAKVVHAEIHATIDIDHIRFFPISHIFHVDVFDASGQVTATIIPNGSIKRRVYNKYGYEIASIDEEGNLLELNSMSKTGRLLVPDLIQGHIGNLLFKATENQYYNPIEWWKKWKIAEIDKIGIWSFAPGQMWHKSSSSHNAMIPSSQLNMKSIVFRFDYTLDRTFDYKYKPNIRLMVANTIIADLVKGKEGASLSLCNSYKTLKLPSIGELVILLEDLRVVVWTDGVSIADFEISQTWQTTLLQLSMKTHPMLTIEFTGLVVIENFAFINNPSLTVEYLNSWGEPTQVINLESQSVAQITETIHDMLGRRSITTKATRMKRTMNERLLDFYDSFILNDKYEDKNSVWFTHHLEGNVDTLNPSCKGFPYKRTEFEKNPSRDIQAIGLPGKEFSIIGPYAKRFQSMSDEPFLLNLFPIINGFKMYTTVNENGSRKVNVNDVNDKKVAVYVRVPGYDHILSINEYNSKGQIVKVLPPRYHEADQTITRGEPWKFGYAHLTDDEINLQVAYGSIFKYDEDENMIMKSTPDGGFVHYIYDDAGNRRFMKMGNGVVVYFLYNDAKMLIETGHLRETLDNETLKSYTQFKSLPSGVQRTVSQEFGYNFEADDPQTRKMTKTFVTHNGDETVTDEVNFDFKNHIVKKSATLSSDSPMNVAKTYDLDKLSTMTYPRDSSEDKELSLVYKYDKKGFLTSIGIPNAPTQYAQFSYAADGQLESEKILPGSEYGFTRTFEYQTAGYLEKIEDPFLTEEMTYTSNGYGQGGFGDGIISSTSFQAKWSSSVDPQTFKVRLSELDGDKRLLTRCFKLLKQSGYLSVMSVVEKALNFKTNDKLPLECKGKIGYQIAEAMARRQVPKLYGHRYAYGNHQELTKAKYFTDEASMKLEPLQPNSFNKKLKDFSIKESHEVWEVLVEKGFIVADQIHVNLNFAVGKQGNEFFIKVKEIEDALSPLSSTAFDSLKVVPGIVNWIVKMISQKSFATEDLFESAFLAMHDLTTASMDWRVLQMKRFSSEAFKKLSAKNLLPIYPSLLNSLNPKLVASLKKYIKKIPEILGVVNSFLINNLGESPFDLHSYNIDANGNHAFFYNGYKRYQLNYRGFTNKIESVQIEDITSSMPRQTFAIEHDGNGNIIKAMHKGIVNIEYFQTSQRTKEITMNDGRKIKFFYDAVGERIMKQVFNAKGILQRSMKYVRDEVGRVLMDIKTIYMEQSSSSQKILTKYIYGPRGLIGFYRNGDFFSVTTDHLGSVRLVIRNGQVVASFDYLPYGELAREYITRPDYDISYRFTGQEFDAETGLYNYHARLYDPSIGRFCQIDPQAQYFSPYLYTGNSPISFVDPDGQFADLVVYAAIGLALLGGYLGGAKAGDSWNPADWKLKDPNLYLSIAGGAIGKSD